MSDNAKKAKKPTTSDQPQAQGCGCGCLTKNARGEGPAARK